LEAVGGTLTGREDVAWANPLWFLADIDEIEKTPLQERMPFLNTYRMLRHGASMFPCPRKPGAAYVVCMQLQPGTHLTELQILEFLRKEVGERATAPIAGRRPPRPGGSL
jgi:hypothetical protein